MAITFHSGATINTTGTSASVSLTNSTSDLIVGAGRAGGGGGQTVTLSDSSADTFTQIDTGNDGGGGNTYVSSWAIASAANQTCTITATGNSTGSLRAVFESYTGVATTTPVSGTEHSQPDSGATTSFSTGNTTPADNNCLTWAYVGINNWGGTETLTLTNGSFTFGTTSPSGGTSGGISNALNAARFIQVGGSGTAVACTWTSSIADNYRATIVSFKPAGAAASTFPLPMQYYVNP